MASAPKLVRFDRGRLGPADHGRPMSFDQFMAGDYVGGYKYELIDGKLYVAPESNLPEDRVETWLYRNLDRYASVHPEVINYVTSGARVFVPASQRTTCPEPDVAAYRGFPLDLPFQTVRWQDVSPLLVIEVPSVDDPNKDYARNRELYLQVTSIREYWILDTRADPERPTLRVHRRWGRRWRVIDLGPGDTYTTKLLPGFELLIDPRS
jgi:Uma2 family endonuclease